MTKRFTIVVAGGSGSRMNSEVPKQFLLIDNKPILIHTLEKFETELILVLPKTQIEYWIELSKKYNFKKEIKIVEGGNTRFDSVKNGLKSILNENGIVAIHDGVRPFVTKALIEKLFIEAEKNNNAIPFTYPKESIRKVEKNKNYAVNRSDYRFIQTPQVFDLKKIKEAYTVEYKEYFTDDASVFESNNNSIHLVEGEYSNIKITTLEDLK